jgi:acetate---CoA ligase (ADP-forming)
VLTDAVLPRPDGAGAFLSEDEGKMLLSRYGIQTPRETVATSPAGTAAAAEAIGFPVVLKVVSPDLPHKSEAGAVRLGVGSAQEALGCYDEMMSSVARHSPGARVKGMLVAEHVLVEHELLCGFKRDPQFGPTVVVALGGVFTEVLKDAAFGVAPLDHIDAMDMIMSLRGRAVLAGARGKTPVDFGLLASTLVSISLLAMEHPEIEELDVNPLAWTADGRLVALDCMVKLGP